jgi:hypothetical protein
MRISTKTVASLLLITAVAAAVPGVSEKIPTRQHFRRESQFDRLLQRHDRKGELRAEILGMETHVFRAQLKHMSLEMIARQRGFKSVREFRIALLGRLKEELHRRGWSFRRIEQYMVQRGSRVG